MDAANRFSPDVAVPVRFAACFTAWRRARRGKKPSANQLAFEACWLDKLQDLHTTLRSGRWQGHRTVSFVVSYPKTCEIHAPDFADRVVHHVLVERLEKIYEPIFIHDSFANRRGKGSHAAVARLQTFMRQRENMAGSGITGGWAGIYSWIFITISTAITAPPCMPCCARLAVQERRGLMHARHALALRSLCHKLLERRVSKHARDPAAARQLPAHTWLCHAAAGCGLPVGNLTSQFFANVCLNELDQFVKHTLKVRHYVRYVDDFVLLGESPEQLRAWQVQIADFLQSTLRLKLRHDFCLQPCDQGVDFLGYVVFARHRRVRERVVQHCRSKLKAWHQQHAKKPLRPSDVAQLQALLGSYWGHLAHANSVRLRVQLFEQMPWLKTLFNLGADARLYLKALARWRVARHRAVRQFLKPEGEKP